MSAAVSTPSSVEQPPRLTRVRLIGIEVFVAIGAAVGCAGLVVDNVIGMPADWLDRTPFSTWTWPGVLLLLIVGVPMVIAATAEIRRSRGAYFWSFIAGAAQIGWIVAQWLIIGKFFVLQPIMLGAGIAVVLLTVSLHGRQHREMHVKRSWQ